MTFYYAFFGCPHCGNLKSVPFSCKSPFCPSCGNKYNQKHTFHISCKLLSCNHRHCVATTPEEIRIFFLRDHSLLNCLFHCVRNVILCMFFKLNKSEHFSLGFVCVLHTFGRDLKWNPHIHALISEGRCQLPPWLPNTHFSYDFLRQAFSKVLLGRLSLTPRHPFKNLKHQICKDPPAGFYTRAKPNLCSPDITIEEISRYLGRPVIATSRIDTYDGALVTFGYQRHEDHKTLTECVPPLTLSNACTYISLTGPLK